METLSKSCHNAQTFTLRKHEVRSLILQKSEGVFCVSGDLWLTANGCDIHLAAGETYRAKASTLIVIEALNADAVFSYEIQPHQALVQPTVRCNHTLPASRPGALTLVS